MSPNVELSLLWDVNQSASFLGVSPSWVRRHKNQLPSVRVGRLLRFDPELLRRHFRGETLTGNRVEQKGAVMFQAKTRYQSGRVYKKGKKAVMWYGQFREDRFDAEGKLFRAQKNVCLGSLMDLPTKQAAKQELARRMGVGIPKKLDMLFRDLLPMWRAAVVPTLRNTTADVYEYALKAYVLPAFGEREITGITRFDVALFLAEKAKTFCRATVRIMRVSLSRVLGWAVLNGWLEKNPCIGVPLPVGRTKVKRTVLTPEQVAALVSKLHEPYSTLVLLLATTGLRISEAVGVRVEDFAGNVLRLRYRYYQSNGGGDYGELKTRKSVRNLPLPEWLANRIKGLADKGHGYCFRSEAKSGTPINQKNALRRYIHPACEELGFKIGGWHCLRHTVATMALKSYPVKTVSEMLGHSNIRTTLDVYQHVSETEFAGPIAELAGKLLHDVA